MWRIPAREVAAASLLRRTHGSLSSDPLLSLAARHSPLPLRLNLSLSDQLRDQEVPLLELEQCLKSLRIAKEPIPDSRILIQVDSKTVQGWLQGNTKVEWRARRMVREFRGLILHFRQARLMYMWREANQPADWLSKFEALAGPVTWSEELLPEELKILILNDARGAIYRREGTK